MVIMVKYCSQDFISGRTDGSAMITLTKGYANRQNVPVIR